MTGDRVRDAREGSSLSVGQTQEARFLFSERERPNLVVRVRVRIEAPDGDLHAGLPAFATPVEELM